MPANKIIALKNDEPAVIRRITPADRDALLLMHDGCSPQSMRQRYLRAHTPTAEEMDEVCQLHPAQGTALVAEIRHAGIVGYGYYMRLNKAVAEPAMMIADPYQGLGLGKALFAALASSAQGEGLDHFEATMSAGNQGMLQLLRKGGYDLHGHYAFGSYELTIAWSVTTIPQAV